MQLKRLTTSPIACSVLTLVLAVVALLGIDSVGSKTPSAPTPALDAPSASPGTTARAPSARHSVLVLLVDGLRYETALDSLVMPNVRRLSAEGASGKLETVFEGFSVPAIKAAFTGTAETQLVNVVRNFSFSSLPLESVFLDAERASKRVLIVGDEPFRQFGTRAERRLPKAAANLYASDAERPAMALDAWIREDFDVVVCHYETTDWRAHEFGIFAPQYKQAFQTADSIIGAFAAARGSADYLIVFGDHGHNAAGEHKTGLYIPSYLLMLGPDVRHNTRFTTLGISTVRLLMSHAIGVNIHTAPYDVPTVSAFLPLEEDHLSSGRAEGDSRQKRSGLPLYLYALCFVLGSAGLLVIVARVNASANEPHRIAPLPTLIVILIVLGEIAVQQLWAPAFSVMPFLVLAAGAQVFRHNRARSVLVCAVGLFFVSRWLVGAGTLTLHVPASLLSLVPLYVAGSIARFVILLQLLGKRRWVIAAALSGVMTVICVRVWDHPALSIGSIVVAGIGALIARQRSDATLQRALLVTAAYLLLYYTVRLPIYQLFWIDLFLLALMLCYGKISNYLFEGVVLSGAFTLSSLWLSSGLEWGFLYDLLPAYTLEHHVAWFLPLIAAKLPLVLLLAAAILAWYPGRSFVLMAIFYAGARFVVAWLARIVGADTRDVWPLAEQGLYLVAFVVAALILNGIRDATLRADPFGIPDPADRQPATWSRL